MNLVIIGYWVGNKGDQAVTTFIMEMMERSESVERVYVTATKPKVAASLFRGYGKVSFVPYGSRFYAPEGSSLFAKVMRRVHQVMFCRVDFPRMVRAVMEGEGQKGVLTKSASLVRLYRESSGAIVTGGHHLTTMRDTEMIAPIPYDMGLACLSHTPLYLWSQSIGPLDIKGAENKGFVARLLGAAKELYVREPSSVPVVEDFGVDSKRVRKTYDSVFGLAGIYSDLRESHERDDCMGVSLFFGNMRTQQEEDRYVEMMVGFVSAAHQRGLSARFFPMEATPREYALIGRIEEGVPEACVSIADTNVDTYAHMKEVSRCRFFLGHKTHSVVFALCTNTPLIALEYHPKTKEFMRLFGMERFSITDTLATQEWFEDALQALIEDEASLIEKIDEKNESVSETVIGDFEAMLTAIEGEGE